MKLVEPVDPYRAYRYLPEANSAYPMDGKKSERKDHIGPDSGSLREFYGDQNDEVVKQLEELIFGSHQVKVLLGQRHFAPSPTWRDEFLMDHGYEFISRFAVRVHLFEKVGEGVAGRYLGFVSLRPPGSKQRYEKLLQRSAERPGITQHDREALKSAAEREHYRWIIEAELTYPTHMLRPRYHIISTTASSARLGVLPFRSTVYMYPNMATPGSSCTHVALSQALHLVMGRFGSRPISQREFEMLLWVQANQLAPGAGGSHVLASPPATYQTIRMHGANLREALSVVRAECHGGGFLAFFPAPQEEDEGYAMREAQRCLTDTLANGLPVIMDVDAEVLADWKPEYRQGPLPEDAKQRNEEAERSREMAHAILIFGMRLIAAPDEALPPLGEKGAARSPREDAVELPGRFVGHDTMLGPFSEWRTERMLDAALAAYPLGDARRGIYMLALGPASMKLGMDEVRQMARIQMSHLARGSSLHLEWCDPYLNKAKITFAHLRTGQDPWRYVIRLHSRSEIRRRYSSATVERAAGTQDTAPVLDGAASPLPPSCRVSKEDMQLLDAALDSLVGETCGTHFWSVEVIWGAEPPTTHDDLRAVLCTPALVMFFHAGEDKDEHPSLRFALLRWQEGRLEYQETADVQKAQAEPLSPPHAESPKVWRLREEELPSSLMRFPEVSLISSWHLPPPHRADASGKEEEPTLEALRIALDQQLGLLDLYFLDDSDVPWYWSQLHDGELPPKGECPSALDFAAGLDEGQIETLARALSKFVVDHYKGRLVGPRPRFAAIATYWPHLSVPQGWQPDDKRPAQSVQAVRNSLLLASHLGCRHVEIVGGSALPEIETDLDGNPMMPEKEQPEGLKRALRDSDEARDTRRDALVRNLCEIYTEEKEDGRRGAHPYFPGLSADGRDGVPKLCLEVEPGEPFLINNVQRYVDVRNELDDLCKHTASHVLLNVDIAHMMLCRGEERRSGADCQMDVIETVQTRELQRATARGERVLPGLKSLIGHMHVSDHARTHASDLTPGSYHFFHDFLPWLQLAVELTAQPGGDFSGAIAVEMETCADVHEAARSIGRIRRWLEAAPHFGILRPPRVVDSNAPGHDAVQDNCTPINKHKGSSPAEPALGDSRLLHAAIIVVDIGNSTSWALATGSDQKDADCAVAENIQKMVGTLCGKVHRHRGSVLSFTGDGVVAIFDRHHFSSEQACAFAALEASRDIASCLLGMIDEGNPADKRTARVSLHWGRVFMPTTSTLRYQAIGLDVILACRLCGWVKAELERGELSEKNKLSEKNGPSFLDDPDYPSRNPGVHNAEGRAFLACTGAFYHLLKKVHNGRVTAHQLEAGLPAWEEFLYPRENFAPQGFEKMASHDRALQAYAIHSGHLGVAKEQKASAS